MERGCKLEKNTQQRKFGFITTVAMIVGIVVGSGIFFKTPQIMERVGGNILMGGAVFLVAALGIIFGGLTVSLYAQKNDLVGGIITYSEMAWGKTVGYLAGWFQMVFYFPAICAVIAWAAANYTCALFGLPNLLVNGTFGYEVWVITLAYLLGVYAINCFATMAAGKFQNIAMFVKLGALAVISIGGLIKGDTVGAITSSASTPVSSAGFLSALIVVIFAFDGWMVAPSIAHEIKNPKRNLPLALMIAPLIITAVYLAYFLGASALVSPEQLASGTDPLQIVATKLFGDIGMKVIMIFVIISVLGTLNGLVLGYIRLPYALAVRKEIRKSDLIGKMHPKFGIPVVSVLLTLCLILLWCVLHFLSIDGPQFGFTLLKGLEVDNLPIVLTYLFNGALYVAILVKGMKGTKLSFVQRFVFPSLALIGAGLIIYGGIIQPKFNVYFIICCLGILAGWLLKPRTKKGTLPENPS